jgi:hypothetical protein
VQRIIAGSQRGRAARRETYKGLATCLTSPSRDWELQSNLLT